jgi:spore photoproduct lyase
MESLFGFAGKWMGFAAEQPALTVEIRTKSAVVLPMKPAFNVIMAWTITPGNYEKGAPSADKRLAALSKALDGGWPVRLCIDPVLPVHGWEDGLQRLTARIKQSIDVSRLHSVGAGGFRCSSAHYKRMRKHHPGSVITALPVAEQNGVITCPPEIETKIKSIVEKGLTP